MENVVDLAKQRAMNNAESAQGRTVAMSAALGGSATIIGINLALLIGRSITKPVKRAITGLNESADQVSSTSQLLAQGVDQINSAISQTDKVTQQNATGAEESAFAGQELRAQTQMVKGMVQNLIDGSRGNMAYDGVLAFSARK